MDSSKNRFKSISPQRHREHREKLFIVNSAAGAVNKVKLCALCASVVKYLLAFDVSLYRNNSSQNLPWQVLQRINRFAIFPYFKMQARA